MRKAHERVPDLVVSELHFLADAQAAPIALTDLQQDVGQAPRPLVFLNDAIGEGGRPVSVRHGIDREHPAPAAGGQHQGGREVLRQLWTKATDLLERGGSYRVVRSDARGRVLPRVSRLLRTVEGGLQVKAPSRSPAFGRVFVANARRGYVTNGRIAKRSNHLPQVSRGRNVIGVQLRDDVVIPVAPVVVEVGQIAFLAPGPTRPRRAVVALDSLPAGDLDAVLLAPAQGLRRRGLVRQPNVVGVGVVLPQHAVERFRQHDPRFGGRLGHDDGRSQPRDRETRIRPLHPIREEEEPSRQKEHLAEDHHRNDDHPGWSHPVIALKPPDPEDDHGADPDCQERAI